METDAEFRRRVDDYHKVLRDRLHAIVQDQNAAKLTHGELANSIALSLQEIQSTLKAQDKQSEQLAKTISSIEHAINGNGKPGMKADIATLASKIELQAATVLINTSRLDGWDSKAWWLVGGVIAAIGMAAWRILLASGKV